MSYEVRSLYSNRLSRRAILRGTGLGLGGVAGGLLVGCGDDGAKQVDLADESLPPEVTKVRLPSYSAIGWSAGSSLCTAPLALAPDFFPDVGLTADLVTVPADANWAEMVNDGTFHLTMDFMSSAIAAVTASKFKLTFLAGVHSGCVELFAREETRAVSDLAGKRVAVPFGDSATEGGYAFMVMLMDFIGLPNRLVSSYDAARLPALLQSREVDAVLAYQPQAENLRGLEGVHVLVSTADDKPWSDYYCCTLFANSQFARKNPIATKRAMRAILKATDMIALEPERSAKRLLELDSALDYAQTLRFLKHLPYGLWRSVNPEDSLRFWALRLKEIGEIQATPDQVIKHADWRFLNQLKRDMAYAPGFPQQRGAFALDCDIEALQGPVAS